MTFPSTTIRQLAAPLVGTTSRVTGPDQASATVFHGSFGGGLTVSPFLTRSWSPPSGFPARLR
jgi:hypothetical protein